MAVAARAVEPGEQPLALGDVEGVVLIFGRPRVALRDEGGRLRLRLPRQVPLLAVAGGEEEEEGEGEEEKTGRSKE
jgi:hypothetical protein